jgi:hypothetical protein
MKALDNGIDSVLEYTVAHDLATNEDGVYTSTSGEDEGPL